MAREGLRTLVVAKKVLTVEQYVDFEQRLTKAKLSMQDRNQRIQNVIESLEKDLELLCLTGVEDKLQQNVRTTLETLRNAGIKVNLKIYYFKLDCDRFLNLTWHILRHN